MPIDTSQIAWSEVVIILFIFIGMGVVIWKSGARNPIATGPLEKRINTVQHKVDDLHRDVERLDKSTASSDDLDGLRDQFQSHRRRVAEISDDIGQLRNEVASLGKSGAAQNMAIEALAESVRAIDADMKAHRAEVLKRLQLIERIEERVNANGEMTKDGIEKVYKLLERDSDTQAQLAAVQEASKATRRQVDRIYDLMLELKK